LSSSFPVLRLLVFSPRFGRDIPIICHR
jgi:hypothetical protein